MYCRTSFLFSIACLFFKYCFLFKKIFCASNVGYVEMIAYTLSTVRFDTTFVETLE